MSEDMLLTLAVLVALGASAAMGHFGAALELLPTLQYMFAAMGAGWVIWITASLEVERIRREQDRGQP